MDLISSTGINSQELEGAIGATMRSAGLPPLNAAQMAAAKAGAANFAISRDILSRGQKHLNSRLSDLSVDLQRAIKEGKTSFIDIDYYIRKQVSAAGDAIQPLLESSSERKVGTTNFDKNKFDCPVSVSAVRLAYALSIALIAASAAKFSNTDVVTPASLLNGELVITRNGTEVITIPVAKAFNIGGAYAAVQNNFDVIRLDAPLFFKQDDSVGVSIRMPEGSTFPAGNHYVEARLIGTGIKVVS